METATSYQETQYTAKTVLVVDDDPFIQAMHIRMVSNLGDHIILQAASAKEALCYLQDPNQTIDLVLCDLAMPDIDGLEMLKEAAARTSQRPNIVFISQLAEGMGPTAELITQSEGFKVLPTQTKPLRPDSLAAIFASL